MKAKAAFSQIIQPKLVQYMIDKYGKSYDTIESVKNSWRLTYPVSDEIIDEIFVQIKTIERMHLGHPVRSETYQTLLTTVIADHLCRYVKRSASYQNLTKAEIKESIRKSIDMSENKTKKAQFVIKQSQPEFLYIHDISKTENDVTLEAQDVLWHLYRHNKLENRRLFYKDTLDNIREIQHENGIFKDFAEGHFKDINRRPRVGDKKRQNESNAQHPTCGLAQAGV